MSARLEILEELEDGEEEDLARRHGGLQRTDSGLSTVSCGSWASEASDLQHVQVILASHWSGGWNTGLSLVTGVEYWSRWWNQSSISEGFELTYYYLHY